MFAAGLTNQIMANNQIIGNQWKIELRWNFYSTLWRVNRRQKMSLFSSFYFQLLAFIFFYNYISLYICIFWSRFHSLLFLFFHIYCYLFRIFYYENIFSFSYNLMRHFFLSCRVRLMETSPLFSRMCFACINSKHH